MHRTTLPMKPNETPTSFIQVPRFVLAATKSGLVPPSPAAPTPTGPFLLSQLSRARNHNHSSLHPSTELMIALCLLAPLLAGQIIAAQADSASSRLRRDHDSNKAFASSVTSGCSDDWPLCGTSGVCYNPHEGQTCCPGGTCSFSQLRARHKRYHQEANKNSNRRLPLLNLLSDRWLLLSQ